MGRMMEKGYSNLSVVFHEVKMLRVSPSSCRAVQTVRLKTCSGLVGRRPDFILASRIKVGKKVCCVSPCCSMHSSSTSFKISNLV